MQGIYQYTIVLILIGLIVSFVFPFIASFICLGVVFLNNFNVESSDLHEVFIKKFKILFVRLLILWFFIFFGFSCLNIESVVERVFVFFGVGLSKHDLLFLIGVVFFGIYTGGMSSYFLSTKIKKWTKKPK